MRLFKPILLLLLAAGGVVLALSSFSVSPKKDYGYTPVFMKRADLKNSVSYQSGAREMKNPGKIYVKDDIIYVNERYRGVHIIDNSNPEHPRQTGFIVAPGCIDMAVKDHYIYLDNSVDLVTLDMLTWKVTERLEDFFPEPSSPSGQTSYSNYGYVVVGWE